MKITGSTGWQFEDQSIWSRIFTAVCTFLFPSAPSSVAHHVAYLGEHGEQGEQGAAAVSSSGDSKPCDDQRDDQGYQLRYRPGRTDRDSLWFMSEVQYQAVLYLEKTGKEAYLLGYSQVDGREITHYCFLGAEGYRTTCEEDAAARLRRMNAEIDGAFP